jgi:hypothetical protein
VFIGGKKETPFTTQIALVGDIIDGAADVEF